MGWLIFLMAAMKGDQLTTVDGDHGRWLAYTAQKSQYPPGNHHASHWYWWRDTSIITRAGIPAIIKVSGHQYLWFTWWLWPGNRIFLEVASMVVTWWIVAFCPVLWCFSSILNHTYPSYTLALEESKMGILYVALIIQYSRQYWYVFLVVLYLISCQSLVIMVCWW